MFQHRSKCILYQLGLLLFFLLLIFGQISAKDETKSTSTEGAEYDEDSKDESPADNQKPSGPIPSFDEPERTLFAKPGKNITIDCPAKDFDIARHQFLWMKDENIIVNGGHVTKNEYQIDDKRNLIIANFTEQFKGTYICRIEPNSIQQRTIVKIEENNANGNNRKAAWAFVLLLPMLISGLSF